MSTRAARALRTYMVACFDRDDVLDTTYGACASALADVRPRHAIAGYWMAHYTSLPLRTARKRLGRLVALGVLEERRAGWPNVRGGGS